MSETTFERGKTITYPSFYPKLSFTPIFGRNGDFIWVEEVKAAWPEQDDEFTFVRSTVHEQRVDRLKEENAKLRELLIGMAERVTNPVGGCLAPGCAHGCPHHLECDDELHTCWYVDRLRELGIGV